jgi:hypothetical protein
LPSATVHLCPPNSNPQELSWQDDRPAFSLQPGHDRKAVPLRA